MIRLRKIEPCDLPFLYQWENDAAVWSEGNNHNPLSRQDLRAYIESTTGDIYRDAQLRLIIEEVNDDTTADVTADATADVTELPCITCGSVDLFDFDPYNLRAAIGLYIAPEARGKGVGKQVIEKLETYAFGHLNIRLLYAFIAVTNTPCTKLFRSAGYTASEPIPDWTLAAPAVLWYKIRASICK